MIIIWHISGWKTENPCSTVARTLSHRRSSLSHTHTHGEIRKKKKMENRIRSLRYNGHYRLLQFFLCRFCTAHSWSFGVVIAVCHSIVHYFWVRSPFAFWYVEKRTRAYRRKNKNFFFEMEKNKISYSIVSISLLLRIDVALFGLMHTHTYFRHFRNRYSMKQKQKKLKLSIIVAVSHTNESIKLFRSNAKNVFGPHWVVTNPPSDIQIQPIN